MKANLILYCEGLIINGFSFCGGVENIVLDLETVEHKNNYAKLIEYLDKIPKVFDGPCFNNNIIGNALYKLYEWEMVDDKQYKNISHFYRMHCNCGLILRCDVKEAASVS